MNYSIQHTVEYLNSVANKTFVYEDAEYYLTKLLEKGFNVNHFKIVIDKKVKRWKQTPYDIYLRPSTLFGDKFEMYLNEQQRTNKIQQYQSAVDAAKSHKWKLDY